MAFQNIAKKIIESVGRNNNPMYAVIAVATANSIFKPISTMLDKKESRETKEYTALREFLTECVAIPTYYVSAKLPEKFAAGIKDPNRAKLAKSNLSFIGVCLAAGFVIPALCSVVIKPMTDRIYGRNSEKSQPAKLDKKANLADNASKKVMYYPQYHTYSFASFRNGGMKV